jgi:hypothetical protein
MNWSYPPIRSEDLDPCPTSLVMSYARNQRWRQTLGSRVDAPQKPNCRSPVQGLEQQGLRRRLPSRFSVHAESRDGNTLTFAAGLWFWRFCSRVPSARGLLYLTSRRGKLKEKGLHAARQGTGSWRTRVSHAADDETSSWKVYAVIEC